VRGYIIPRIIIRDIIVPPNQMINPNKGDPQGIHHGVIRGAYTKMYF